MRKKILKQLFGPFFTLIILLFLLPCTVRGESVPFTDVNKSSWSYSSIVKCYEKGWIAGTSATTFSPMDKLTRAQFVTILGRYAKVNAKDKEYQKTKFKDVNFSSWGYAPYVSWAEQNGIANGVDSTHFNPSGNVSRAQLAVF